MLGPALILSGTMLFAESAEQPRDGEAVFSVSAALCRDMKLRHVLHPGAPVGCDRLKLAKFGYVGFDGQIHSEGHLVVMDAVADHVLQIFVTLRKRRFPLASAKLMNEFDGNDDASMDQNNTSAFNHRKVAGSGAISLHAYGVAIDLNPIQNPYVERSGGKLLFSPRAGAAYQNRKNLRPGMAETIVEVFADQGLSTWGADWNNPDYQHFQVSRKLAAQLARLPPIEAKAAFERHVERYRACVQASGGRRDLSRKACNIAEN